jgi:hypothetical protein
MRTIHVMRADFRGERAGRVQDPPHIADQKTQRRRQNYEALFAKLWIAAVSLS